MEFERPNVLKFSILAVVFLYKVYPIISQHGILIGGHVAFLFWTFFVICVPIVRGKILIGVPYHYFTGKQLRFPEIFTWIISLGGNMLTLAITDAPYYKSVVTHLLYNIMETPWPLWLVIVVCGVATFYDSLLCNYTHKLTSKKNKYVCNLLILTSFVTTFFLTFDILVKLVNAYGLNGT